MSPLTLDKYLEDTFRFFVIHYLKLDEDLYEYEENIYKDFIAIWCTKGLINTVVDTKFKPRLKNDNLKISD